MNPASRTRPFPRSLRLRSRPGLVASALAAQLLLVGVFAAVAPSCGGGACSLDDGSGCDDGQVCTEDANGDAICAKCSTATNDGCPMGQVCVIEGDKDPACICDVTTGSGCPNGEVCLADDNGKAGCFCNTETEAGCPMGEVCEEVTGTTPDCFPPVIVAGQVFDLATKDAIAGARVVARDANFAALSGVATTDAKGDYELDVPTPRNRDGSLGSQEFFLRSDASGYLTFPLPPRVALPQDSGNATGSPPRLESSATNIGMIALESTMGLGTVSGTVLSKVPVGTLVVAGGDANGGGAVTGIADRDGTYVVFNVPAGSITVRGYKAGQQLAPANANITAAMETKGVDLADRGPATASVSGSINIVNPGDGSDTSVILAVAETFIPNAARGEAPPGLRVAGVGNAFKIENVPDGNYVVLAAFENDFLVRDPDTGIGGTSIVHVTVSGHDTSLPESFKVTGALDVVSPDAEEVVSGTPTFVFADDSGEDHYEIHVFDAFGNQVWEDTNIPKVTGSATVSIDYGGPALKSGRLYQFRAISIKNGGTPISITEDLRGVFLFK